MSNLRHRVIRPNKILSYFDTSEFYRIKISSLDMYPQKTLIIQYSCFICYLREIGFWIKCMRQRCIFHWTYIHTMWMIFSFIPGDHFKISQIFSPLKGHDWLPGKFYLRGSIRNFPPGGKGAGVRGVLILIAGEGVRHILVVLLHVCGFIEFELH